MASIKGISLKNVKTFRGHEYPTNYQGNVYFNGKKMGFWSQDSWGGPDSYDFDTAELDAKAKEFYGEDSIYGLDCLMGELLELMDNEKMFKKAVKEGYSALVVISNGYNVAFIKEPRETNKEVLLKSCASDLEDFKGSFGGEDVRMMAFTCLQDFEQ